tara:strand:- start:845 stop:1111 length:267 start_codon:yes stop_codon:yes gene_type:complete
MSRKIVIDKYINNTVYSVSVFDSYGVEHHIGDINVDIVDKIKIYDRSIASHAHEIWSNEVEPEEDLLGNAIAECIEIDKKNNIEPNLD